MLDVEVGSDDFELLTQRRKLRTGSQHAAQQSGEPHQRIEGAIGRGLDQVSNRCQRIEEKMRVQLRTKRTKLCLGGEPAHLTLAVVALYAFLRRPYGVDPPRSQKRNSFNDGDVIGQQSTPAFE